MTTPVGAAFRELLRAKIQELDLTQREAAEAIGCSQQALSSWLRGDSIPSRVQVPRLAQFLGIPDVQIRAARVRAEADMADRGRTHERLTFLEDDVAHLVEEVAALRDIVQEIRDNLPR